MLDQELLFNNNTALKIYKSFDDSYHGIKTKSIIDKYDFKRLTNDYTNWVKTDIHGCIEASNPHNFKNNHEWFNGYYGIPSVYKPIYKWFKLSKRGNDVYNWKLKTRINSVLSQFDDIDNHKKSDDIKSSNALFITFTFNPKVYKTINSAWLLNSKEFNLFLSNVRRRYGDVYHVRCYEAHKSGYPHIHCILIFKNHDFNVIKHTSTHRKHEGKITYRLKYDELQFFKSKWNGHLDIEAVSNLRYSLGYLFKYILKDLESASLTTVLNWYFDKRSYSLSKQLNENSLRLDIKKSNSNILNRLTQQTQLNGDKFKLGFKFIGFFKLNGIKNWYFTTSVPPDEYIKSLNNFNNSIHN